MEQHRPEPESCESQRFEEQPAENWGVDDLGRFAHARHQEIETDEASLAQAYWRLGLPLNLARSHFARGQWAGFLDEWGVDKTRASKARAIQRSFKTQESVAGLSVQEAYKQRKRKVGKRSAKKSRPSRRETGPDIDAIVKKSSQPTRTKPRSGCPPSSIPSKSWTGCVTDSASESLGIRHIREPSCHRPHR